MRSGPVKRCSGSGGFSVTRIISVANQKGGVGKTTTAVNLAAALAADGRRVLLVDLDPQGNASSGVGIPTHDVEIGAYHVLLGEARIDRAVLETDLDSLYLLPSHKDLAGAPLELSGMDEAHYKLKRALDRIKVGFDYVVIDCPPALDLLTLNALTASDAILVTVQCEYYAMEGLSKLSATIATVKEELNPALEIEGILFTMYDARTSLAQQVVEEVKSYFGSAVFETMVPRNIRLSEAPSFGMPCIVYDYQSRGSQAYLRLAREIDARYTKKPESRKRAGRVRSARATLQARTDATNSA